MTIEDVRARGAIVEQLAEHRWVSEFDEVRVESFLESQAVRYADWLICGYRSFTYKGRNSRHDES